MRLAAIVTAYGARGERHLPGILDALAAQTRRADEVWVLTEGFLHPASTPLPVALVDLPTPRNENDRYAVIPYSWKINHALDATSADAIVYGTDDSLPHPEKFERMLVALEEHPVVYCGQRRNGSDHLADRVVADAYCILDHTQVMHRSSEDRWPLDVGQIKLGDAHFWRALHTRFGAFHPVGGPVLDTVQQTTDGLTASY